MTTLFTNPSNSNRFSFIVTFFRLYLGAMFIVASWGKVSAGSAWSERMIGFLNHQQSMPGWYRALVDGLIIPNADLFAYLTAYGELLLGISLLLGCLMRPAIILGLFMVIHFMLAKGISPFRPTNHDTFYILLLYTVYLCRAQTKYKLDDLLKSHLPKWLF